MREIKARQWINGAFHYWGFTQEGSFLGPAKIQGDKFPPSELFTGIFDKNEKEIFGGDVVRVEHEELFGVRSLTGVVEYIDSGAIFSIAFLGDGEGVSVPLQAYEEPEIIGNKWENPELLENAEKK